VMWPTLNEERVPVDLSKNIDHYLYNGQRS
jgi:hypothetical protein